MASTNTNIICTEQIDCSCNLCASYTLVRTDTLSYDIATMYEQVQQQIFNNLPSL